MRKTTFIPLVFVLFLSVCCYVVALDDNPVLYNTYIPMNQEAPDESITLIPILVQDIISLRGIYQEDKLRFSEEIKKNFFQQSIFEIRELTEAGRKLWPSEKMEKCDDVKCLQELGKLIAVEKIIQVKIGKFGRNYSLSLAVFDVKEGRFEKTASKGCSCKEDELIALLNRSALELLGLNANNGLPGKAPKPSPPVAK